MERLHARSGLSLFLGVAKLPHMTGALPEALSCASGTEVSVGDEALRRSSGERDVASDAGSATVANGGLWLAADREGPIAVPAPAGCSAGSASGCVRAARTLPRMLRELRASMIFLSAFVGVARYTAA